MVDGYLNSPESSFLWANFRLLTTTPFHHPSSTSASPLPLISIALTSKCPQASLDCTWSLPRVYSFLKNSLGFSITPICHQGQSLLMTLMPMYLYFQKSFLFDLSSRKVISIWPFISYLENYKALCKWKRFISTFRLTFTAFETC